jgi:hypothetical protein
MPAGLPRYADSAPPAHTIDGPLLLLRPMQQAKRCRSRSFLRLRRTRCGHSLAARVCVQAQLTPILSCMRATQGEEKIDGQDCEHWMEDLEVSRVHIYQTVDGKGKFAATVHAPRDFDDMSASSALALSAAISCF